MKKCGHRQSATAGGCSQWRGSTLRFPWPPAPSQLHLATCPSAATYRDSLAGPQHILGGELVGNLLPFQDLPLDPPVAQRLILRKGAGVGTGLWETPGGLPRGPRGTGQGLTLSELFFSCTNLPSRSISSMLTLPEAEACCARWKLPPLLLEPRPLEPVPGGSSTSSRFRLLRPGRPAVDTLLPLLLVVAREG